MNSTKRVYVITGATGFLGNNIVRKLSKTAEEIRVIALKGDKTDFLEEMNCKIFRGDITDKASLKEVFEFDEGTEPVVIHCAAVVYIKNKPNPLVDSVNINGTANIIEKCLETKARLVCVNSVHAIPEPEDDSNITEIVDFNPDKVVGIYAKSKANAAKLVLESVKNDGLNATIVQPSGIIGPMDYGMSHTTRMIMVLAKGHLPAIVKGGYDFVDVRDVADGVISAVDNGKVGECYILSNKYVTIKDIARAAAGANHVKMPKIAFPISVTKLVAPICETYYKLTRQVPLFTKYSIYTLGAKANFSHEKATQELDFHPRSLEATIGDTVSWFKEVQAI